MFAGSGGLDDHLRVQATRRADGHHVAVGAFQQLGKRGIAGHLILFAVGGQHLGVIIAYGHQLHVVGVLFDGAEMVFGNAATADDGIFNF